MDSITVVLLTQLMQIKKKRVLILPLLKQIYLTYLRPFIERDTYNLNFRYAALLTKRLVSFHEPELFIHFQNIMF